MKFALIVNQKKDSDYSVSSKYVEYLNAKGSEVFSDAPIDGVIHATKHEAIQKCDFVITVGGDGTILRVVEDIYKYDKPVFSINMGTVGYLASLESHEFEKTDLLFSGSYILENRSVLSVCAGNEKRVLCSDLIALNDAVISHGNLTQVMNIRLICNGKDVTSYRADGLIFSSPTGSTAYSLSAGGPIVDPGLEAIEVTPICAHTFNGRSILFKDTAVLEAVSADGHLNVGYLTVDGTYNFRLEPDDTVRVKLADKKIKMVRFENDSFYNILSKKIK